MNDVFFPSLGVNDFFLGLASILDWKRLIKLSVYWFYNCVLFWTLECMNFNHDTIENLLCLNDNL